MPCNACPFAFTDESEAVQNLGCLPSHFDIMKIKQETGKNWTCHDDESKPCAGYVQWCKEEGIDYKEGEPASYQKWYYTGEA